MTSARQHCLDLVKKRDYAQFLCALLMPGASRDAQLALRAFNVETAGIVDKVTDRRYAELRFGFWRQQLDGMFNTEQGNDQNSPPAILELSRAHRRIGFSRGWFDNILDAREQEMGFQARTIAQLEDRLEATQSSLLYLSLEAVGVRDAQAQHAASHIGKGIGISTLLRATKHHISMQQLHIPAELMTKHTVSAASVMRGEPSEQFQDAVFELASLAKNHIEHARELHDVPRAANPALLAAEISNSYLEALQEADFNLFQPRLDQSNYFWLQARLAKNWAFNRF